MFFIKRRLLGFIDLGDRGRTGSFAEQGFNCYGGLRSVTRSYTQLSGGFDLVSGNANGKRSLNHSNRNNQAQIIVFLY